MEATINPGLLIALYYITAGVAMVGVAYGLVMVGGHNRTSLYAVFSTLCANVAVFQIFAALTHTATTLDTALTYDRILIMTSLLWSPLLVALLTIYTQHARTKQYVLVVSVVCLSLVITSIFMPSGGRFSTIKALSMVEFPWGERLHVVTGEVTAISYVARAFIYAVYLWCLNRAIHIYRQGQKLTGALIAAAFLTLFISMSATTLKDFGVLKSIYPGGFAFLFLIVCFTIFIRKEIHESNQALRETTGNLKLELDSHLKTRQDLEFLAYHDALTNLPNRASLLNQLSEMLAAPKQQNERFAILLVNIDRLGVINDALGHNTGDQLLLKIAGRLRANVRVEDFVARFSGDEFVVVATGLSFNYGAGMLADKLLQMLRLPFQIENHLLMVTARIGIALYPDDGDTIASILTASNLAASKARIQGGNKCVFYHPEMSAVFHDRQRLGLALQSALPGNQFELHFQPIIEATFGQVVCMEALLRWHHPTEGMVAPSRFIPVAEETHMIVSIGSWVIEEALKKLSEWRQAGIADIRVAVNLSAQQLLQPDLHMLIANTLSRYDLRGEDLELEITESVMMEDPEKCIIQLSKTRGLGVRISMDDFGTGYSSLSYLKQLPVDTLKIDRSLVSDIETDTNDAIICATAINMAFGLELKTVAEGVETFEQADFLRKLGCEMLQGYYFAKPMPADRVIDFIANHKAQKSTF